VRIESGFHVRQMRARARSETLAPVKVLLVGAGGREHALAWRLSSSPSLSELHAAPGNPGIASCGACHPVRADDAEGLLVRARSLGIDLVVVGPEAPLVAGIADELRHAGIPVFGPGRDAARIEGSKGFAKAIMHSAGVPTAATLSFGRVPCVVKVDGLAAGKGVFVCTTQAELDEALPAAAAFGGPLVIEELLEGEELSVFAISDGHDAVVLPPAQDFKRAFDGDEGPNTGGMGSYAPADGVDLASVREHVHLPVIQELAHAGTPFVGVLFAGLMVTAKGPQVLEFNARFGDPETQSLLPLLDGDLLAALASAAAGELDATELALGPGFAVTVVLAAAEYPERGDSGSPIEGVEAAEATGALVFHAGTALRGDRLVTNGGRILNVTATGETLAEARRRAYAAVDLISFPGMRYRTDIGFAAAARG
jgi:phosphoribosylamine--glycine ligase